MSAELTDWAWRQPLSENARLVLVALADGAEQIDDVAAKSGLSAVAVLDAFKEIAGSMTAIWKGRRPFFRLGERFQDNAGRELDEV